MLFRGNRPDFTWSTSGNYYPWNAVSVIEKKKKNVLRQDYISQLLEYLRSIVLVSRGRKYAVGCLTNYKMIIFRKASINDDTLTYEIFEPEDTIEQYWKFLHCNRTDLGHVDFSVPCGFDIKNIG
jgi:hypothetical protein